MQLIYTIALTGVLLLGLFLFKSMRWNVEAEDGWIALKDIKEDHAQARQLAAFLEQNSIQTKVELQRQSATVRLLYSKKINVTVKVKQADYDQAVLLAKSYEQKTKNFKEG